MEAVAELVVGLDGEVLKRLMALAQARGISLDQLVGELLRAAVEELEQAG